MGTDRRGRRVAARGPRAIRVTQGPASLAAHAHSAGLAARACSGLAACVGIAACACLSLAGCSSQGSSGNTPDAAAPGIDASSPAPGDDAGDGAGATPEDAGLAMDGAGSPPADGSAGGAGDGGRDFSTDRAKFFGDSRCADAGRAALRGLRERDARTRRSGRIVGDEAGRSTAMQHARGTHALHITQHGQRPLVHQGDDDVPRAERHVLRPDVRLLQVAAADAAGHDVRALDDARRERHRRRRARSA